MKRDIDLQKKIQHNLKFRTKQPYFITPLGEEVEFGEPLFFEILKEKRPNSYQNYRNLQKM